MTLEQLLDRHTIDLDRLNNQRRVWLYASSVVLTGIIFLIFGWEWLDGLHSKAIWWLIVSLMLVISVNWWYWTMRVVRIIIHYQQIEYELIKNIYDEVKVFKNDLKEAIETNSK